MSNDVKTTPAYRTVQLLVRQNLTKIKAGVFDPVEIAELCGLAAKILAGKCPKDGCVIKKDGSWRVISNKTGKLWPQTYDTKEDAADAIAAYHLRKQGTSPG